ncbi:MAG: glyoxalase/bleomycin resistance/dioxygenase family protein, partial [Pseudomonadota bacterium]
YAKWMLDDPRVNFAISTRASRAAIGFDHFGMQVDSAEELAELRAAAENATGGQLLDEGATTCCYSSSEKHWTLDPQGIAWEHFHTLDDAPTYHGDQSGDCCIPIRSAPEDNCCVPVESNSEAPGCCG